MPDHHENEKLVSLAVFNGEIEAELVASELRNQGFAAEASGTLTANFRAEGPGRVKVLVYEKDLEAAKAVFDDFRQSKDDIDWDQVDVSGDETV